MEAGGRWGLVSRQRGRVSHNRLEEGLRDRIAALLRDKYADFGPTLASEKLLELEGITVSRETIRQMQVTLALWKPKSRRVRRVFQLRDRRPRFGELIQIDGSPHDWFEGRAPRCTLIVFIDDATSRLTALRLVPVESTRAYLETLRAHVLEHGCLLAFYSDRRGIFRVNAKDAQRGDGKTEFGRVSARQRTIPGPDAYRRRTRPPAPRHLHGGAARRAPLEPRADRALPTHDRRRQKPKERAHRLRAQAADLRRHRRPARHALAGAASRRLAATTHHPNTRSLVRLATCSFVPP